MFTNRFFADMIVFIHAVYVGFVVIGLALILLGAALRWSWVRNFWFRAVHLAAILLVAVEALFGVVCPLTRWENQLRELEGGTAREGSFLGYWMHELIFLDVPNEVMSVGHCLFALAVIAGFLWIPPRWPGRRFDR